MLVNEIMKKRPATSTGHDTVAQAVRIMHDYRCGFVPVAGSSCLEGENLKVMLGTMARRHVRRPPVIGQERSAT
jgi:CBS domain